jgi:hypothetical protein
MYLIVMKITNDWTDKRFRSLGNNKTKAPQQYSQFLYADGNLSH